MVTLGVRTVDNDVRSGLAASRQAASVEGVRTVVNNLQMGNIGRAATAAAACAASGCSSGAEADRQRSGCRKAKASAWKEKGKARCFDEFRRGWEFRK